MTSERGEKRLTFRERNFFQVVITFCHFQIRLRGKQVKRVTRFHSYSFSPEEGITIMTSRYIHRCKNFYEIIMECEDTEERYSCAKQINESLMVLWSH